MDLKQRILDNAKKHFKRIVLPESLEERNLKAADRLIAEHIAQVILIGNPGEIKSASSKLGLTNAGKALIVDPANYDKLGSYADTMVELRKSKGLTKEQALELLKDPLYLATVMIKCGDADGEVSGAIHATGDVLRPAFQFVKTLPGISIVSGAFIMILKDKSFGEDGVMVFADCAVFPDREEHHLPSSEVAACRDCRFNSKDYSLNLRI